MGESFERAPQPMPEEHSENFHTADHKGTTYDVYKLMEAAEALQEETVPIETFDALKQQKYWHDNKGEWLGPSDIIELANRHNGNWNAMLLSNLDWAEHIKGTQAADYQTHHILVVGENEVIDGMHRLTKAWVDGATEIRIKRFESLPPEAENPSNTPPRNGGAVFYSDYIGVDYLHENEI